MPHEPQKSPRVRQGQNVPSRMPLAVPNHIAGSPWKFIFSFSAYFGSVGIGFLRKYPRIDLRFIRP